MIAKSWNVRDQTENELRFQEEKLYTNIEAKFKLIKKVSKIEDAKKIIDEIWRMKKMGKRHRVRTNEKGVQQWPDIVK